MEEVVLPLRVMAALGARRLVLTNAAGGIDPAFHPGDLMVLTDHIASFVPSPLIGPNVDALGPRFPDMTEVYSLRLREKLHAAGTKLGIPLQEGIYLQTTGPQAWGASPCPTRRCRRPPTRRHSGSKAWCGSCFPP